MTLSNFNTTTHAKWILAGEHAVLRASPAIVYPLLEKTLHLHYSPNSQQLHCEFAGDYGSDIQLLFSGVLEHGLQTLDVPLAEVHGHFIVTNNIPVGMGLGVSAAISAALAQWFVTQGFAKDITVADFARRLEDLFHGESSGVDIAGAMASTGIYFKRPNIVEPLIQRWQPNWYLSFCDQVGFTAKCVKQVKQLWQEQPDVAARIDHDMQDSVMQAKQALSDDRETGLPLLVAAINKACICFSQWGLVGGKMQQHINHLLASGALAVKPTGSGDGGFVLSLWPTGVVPHTEVELLNLINSL